jgi:hypothetical protein
MILLKKTGIAFIECQTSNEPSLEVKLPPVETANGWFNRFII